MGDPHVDLQRERLRDHLSGQPGRTAHLLAALDLALDEPGNLTEWDLDEAADRVEALLGFRRGTSDRLLASGHPDLMHLATTRMSAVLAERLVSMGLNPVGVAAIGALNLGCITLREGPFKGAVVEPEACTVVDGQAVSTPSVILGDLVWDAYDDDVTLLGATLPETACAQACGRRVDEIVSSPLTDGLGLFVREAARHGDSDSTTILLRPQETRSLAEIAVAARARAA